MRVLVPILILALVGTAVADKAAKKTVRGDQEPEEEEDIEMLPEVKLEIPDVEHEIEKKNIIEYEYTNIKDLTRKFRINDSIASHTIGRCFNFCALYQQALISSHDLGPSKEVLCSM